MAGSLKRHATCFLFFVTLTAVSLSDRAYACDFVIIRSGRPPNRDVARAVGVIAGYGVATDPVENVASAPSLLVRLDDIISGDIKPGVTQVVDLFFGPDCRTAPFKPGELEQFFPIGTPVAVTGRSVELPRASGTRAIVVELNQGAQVVRIPPNVVRTALGDLDFMRFEPAPAGWWFLDIEYERAVLKLADAPKNQQFRRLENLAYYQGFANMQRARAFYGELVSDSRISASERRRLLKHFAQVQPTAR